MAKIDVQIEMAVSDGTVLSSMEPLAVSAAMGDEINRFNEWLASRNSMPVGAMELSILKNYIGWKLIDEKAGQSTPST